MSVLFSVQIEALRRADSQSKESYRLCIIIIIYLLQLDLHPVAVVLP
jgi:hypothetical protein